MLSFKVIDLFDDLVAVEYVKLCGYGQGRPEKDANLAHLSLDEIAKQLGTSKARFI